MVEYTDELDSVFGALADPTRRSIVRRLSRGPATVGELAEPIDMSLNGVSKHLLVLERAGLLQRRVEGRTHHCFLNAEPMSAAVKWLSYYKRFWEVSLDSLEAWLRRTSHSRSTN